MDLQVSGSLYWTRRSVQGECLCYPSAGTTDGMHPTSLLQDSLSIPLVWHSGLGGEGAPVFPIRDRRKGTENDWGAVNSQMLLGHFGPLPLYCSQYLVIAKGDMEAAHNGKKICIILYSRQADSI